MNEGNVGVDVRAVGDKGIPETSGEEAVLGTHANLGAGLEEDQRRDKHCHQLRQAPVASSMPSIDV